MLPVITIEGDIMIRRRELMLGAMTFILPSVTSADEGFTVPLNFTPDGLTVELSVNGAPCVFRVAVGSGISTIDAATSRRLNLRILGDPSSFYDVALNGQSMHGSLVNAAHLSAGAVTIYNHTFVRLPGDISSENTIGSQLFLQKPCIVDSESKHIRFYPDGKMPLDGFVPIAAKVLHGGVRSNNIVFSCELSGRTVHAGLNTASNHGIVLSARYVKEHGLWSQDSDAPALPVTMLNGKKTSARKISLDDFSIGPFRFPSVSALMINPDSGVDFDNADAIIGSEVLGHFAIAFDLENKILLKEHSDGQILGLSSMWPDVPIISRNPSFSCNCITLHTTDAPGM